jgi:hypothetical protein
VKKERFFDVFQMSHIETASLFWQAARDKEPQAQNSSTGHKKRPKKENKNQV